MTKSESWEEQFDKDYGDKINTWSLGIVAEALNHARLKPAGADASHITKKLRKLVLKALEDQVKAFVAGLPEEEDIVNYNQAEVSYTTGFNECRDTLLANWKAEGLIDNLQQLTKRK